jgi:wyosine [tRNA(Phe)-imidazoG37] synthetase (radical SAM superfamily)
MQIWLSIDCARPALLERIHEPEDGKPWEMMIRRIGSPYAGLQTGL